LTKNLSIFIRPFCNYQLMTLIIFFPKLPLFTLHIILLTNLILKHGKSLLKVGKSLLKINMENQYNLLTNLILKQTF
jgi:hypothetical protein